MKCTPNHLSATVFSLRFSTIALLTVALFAIPLEGFAASDAVTPGSFRVEPPTLLNLGFNWDITGDANRNAAVEVSFREKGTDAWRTALPLLRIGGERIFRAAAYLDYTVPDRFAGSILNLRPETEYECRFTLTDPDGVRGEANKIVSVRTRGEPRESPGGRVLHEYPPNYDGKREQPAFSRLLEAYQGAFVGDWSTLAERKVRPGDVILVHAGLYQANPLSYVDPMGVPFDGTYVLTAKGTADQPIVIKAAGDGEVIFDGGGLTHTLFNVMAADHHIFDGFTFRNVDVVFQAGLRDVLGCSGLTVRNCRFENVGMGINTQFSGSRNFYIADNVFLGRKDRHRLRGWTAGKIVDAQGKESWIEPKYGVNLLTSYYAVRVYGSGHVIAHNAMAYFHDGVGICTHGTPDPDPANWAVSIDIYNNDIHLSADDFIEADGGVHNIRVFRNRGVNAAHAGLSGQPIFGGPAYYYRNVLYHIQAGPPFKFYARCAGVIAYHNTAIAEMRVNDPFSNAHLRNNLFLGTDQPGRPILSVVNSTAYSTSDFNGYRPNKKTDDNYQWAAPPKGELRNDALTMAEHGSKFRNLAELAAATGREGHGLEIDYDVFKRLDPPDLADDPLKIFHAEDLDFTLRSDGKAVDAGMPIPTINDDFQGQAPDLGALELGLPEPVYGPRHRKSDAAFYR